MQGKAHKLRLIGLEIELVIIPKYCEGDMVQEVEPKGITMVNLGRGNAIEQKMSQYYLNGNNGVHPHMFNLDVVTSDFYEWVIGMGFIPTLNGFMVQVGLGQYACNILHKLLTWFVGCWG